MNLAEVERYKGQKIIHKMSFGKDSYAALEAMIEAGLNIHAPIYCDTGWEALDHYRYVMEQRQRLIEVHGLDVITVRAHIELPPELETIALELEHEAGFPEVGVSNSPLIRRTLKYACFSRPGHGGVASGVLRISNRSPQAFGFVRTI